MPELDEEMAVTSLTSKTKDPLEIIKRAGISKALFEEISSRLWTARAACEDARRERFKHMKRELKIVRAALDEAETLYAEWVKYDRG